MQKLWKDFIKCGILGWCLEITFTALHSLQQRKFTLQGTTSLWMFPIYGAGCLLRPICALVKKCHWFVRGCVYALFIFVAEYLSGRFLLKKGLCPWSYGKARWNIGKVIRLDYAPLLVCHRTAHGTGNPVPRREKEALNPENTSTAFPITRGNSGQDIPARYFRFLPN